MSDLFSISGDALPGTAVLVGFRGREAVSELFEITVFLSVDDAGAAEDMVGTKLSLVVHGEPVTHFHGIVAAVDVLDEQATRALVSVLFVPKLYLLGLSRHSRMFTDMRVPDVIEKVLTDAGLGGDDFELRLSGSYDPEEHICQVRESDLAFVSRWLEHEGIHYYFEHTDSAAKLVVTDQNNGASLREGPVRYDPGAGGDHSALETFQRFASRKRLMPQRVTMRDYDDANPSLDVVGETAAYADGSATVVVHGDDRFFAPGRGATLSAVRAERIAIEQAPIEAAGRVFGMRSGYPFELEGHDIDALNQAYLCAELVHTANLRATTADLARLTGLEVGVEYRCDVRASLATAVFRPRRKTARPRLFGYESGVVEGPADSDYAQIDDRGRYHVKLNLDETDLAGDACSTWLRMMQPHAGAPEGMHFPLRKGTEVMVAFLRGDPDRPIIAGAIPNALTPSVVTSDNHTQNVIHTGSDNHIEIEDDAGNQYVFFSTPTESTHFHLGKPHELTSHHFELQTEGNCKFEIGTNQDILVGGKLTETVEGAVEETYKSSQKSVVTGPQDTEVKKDGCVETYEATQTTIVLGDVGETYNAQQDTYVTAKPRTELFLSTQGTTVNDAPCESQFNDNHLRAVNGPTTNTFMGAYTRHATETATMMYPAGLHRIWGPTTRTFDSLNIAVPGGSTVICSTNNITVPSDLWTFISNMKITLLKLEMGLISRGATGAAFGATGVCIEEVGIKREVAGFALGMVGIEMAIAPIEADSRGVKWKFPKANKTET